jgi:hypothetical protein
MKEISERNLHSLSNTILEIINNKDVNNSSEFFNQLVEKIVMEGSVKEALQILEDETIQNKRLNKTLLNIVFSDVESLDAAPKARISKEIAKYNNSQEVIDILLRFYANYKEKKTSSVIQEIKSVYTPSIDYHPHIIQKLKSKNILENNLVNPNILDTFEIGAVVSALGKKRNDGQIGAIELIMARALNKIFKDAIKPKLFGHFMYDIQTQLYSLNFKVNVLDDFKHTKPYIRSEVGTLYGAIGMAFPAEDPEKEISKDFLSLHKIIKDYVCS